MTKVQIRKIDSYDLPALEDAVAEFFRGICKNKLKRSKRVLLKPNLLGAYHPDQAVTTHPAVLEALIRYFLAHGKEVWVGDSPGGTVNAEQVWETCSFKDLAERYPIKLVNLSTAGFRELNYQGIDVKISEVFWQCGIVINVAKYKTHSLMAYTGALKNLYGLIPGMVKSEYHKLYPDTKSFAKLLTALYALTRDRVTYSFIDGITGMDGAGPSAGRVRKFGLLFGSETISALDFTAATMMGFKISDIPYLHDALHLDGVLPSRVSIPTSFRGYSLPEVDIKTVKLSKDMLKYVPGLLRKVFQKAYYYYPVISDRCKRCGICVKSCPVQAIHWRRSGFPRVDKGDCIKCMCCHELCPHRAVDIYKSPIARMVMG
ncbi:MAG: DUF362 domain-containing protein [Candidatus Cloacimonadaceae bacterium]|nr:DUF362 domain-containing protein [Candidatus Cloacimonadaceae bacterium]